MLLVLGVIPLPESMQARRAQPDARGNSTAQRLGKEAMAKVLALSAPSIPCGRKATTGYGGR